MAKVNLGQKLVDWAGSKSKVESMTPAQVKEAASALGLDRAKILDLVDVLQETKFAGIKIPTSNKLQGDIAPAAAARVPQKNDVHAVVAGPPKDIREAESRIADKLGDIADVSLRGPENVEVRFEAKDKAGIDKGLAEIGVRKYNTGIRDGYSFGRFEVTVAPYGTVSMA
jgi:hypothetical protein